MDRKTFEYIWGDGHSFAREILPVGIRAITRWEAFVPRWYEDGHWKSGPKKGEIKYSCMYGHQEGGTNPPFAYDPEQTFTIEEGEETLLLDVASKAQFIRAKVDKSVWLTNHMFNALLSLVFNAGEGNVEQGRVLDLFNQGQYTAAIAAFHDHRFAVVFEKDESGNRIPDPDRPGEFLRKTTEKNGLIVRRGSEMGIAMTKLEREKTNG